MINDDSERVRREVARVMDLYTKIQPENITEQEKPIVVETEITSTTVVETETSQPEKKGENENIVQKLPIVSKRSSTAISKRKSILLWLLPAILVTVISGIVVYIIFFSNRQPIVPPPIVETQKKIEETSKPLEKVEKVPATEIKEVKFRSEPIENLMVEAVEIMIKDKGFFDSRLKLGTGFPHQYEVLKEGKVVYDYASGLMWQQSGSTKEMPYEKAKAYVEALNSQNFAGYRDWRLPTLEEAMSLMEPTKMNGDLYIDPKFDKQQRWIWTTDLFSASSAWVVDFLDGHCDYGLDFYGLSFVRAVR